MEDDEAREARRQKLYEELWAEPATTVAKRYGVSGRAVAKWCEQLCVPVPTRGYWAKPAGRRPKRTPLGKFVEQPRKKAPPRPTALSGEQGARAASFVKARKGATQHPLVLTTRAALARSSRLARTPRGMIDGCDVGCLHLRSSAAQIERVLSLYDLVLRALESRGFSAETTRNGTLIRIGEGDALHLRIAERYRERPITASPAPGLSPDARRHHEQLMRGQEGVEGTGLLVLGLGPYRPDPIMTDDTRRLLEDRVEEVAERALVMLERQRAKQAEWQAAAEERAKLDEVRERSARAAALAEEKRRTRAAWARDHLEGRRLARECREAAQDLVDLCASFHLRVTPGLKIHDVVQGLREYADEVDPTTGLWKELKEWSSQHHGATAESLHNVGASALRSTIART